MTVAGGGNHRERLRQERELEARRQRTRMRVLYVVAGVVLAAIITTVAVVIVRQRSGDELTPEQLAAQISPPNLNAAGTAIVQNPKTNGVPTVTVYLDFQCPACRAFTDTYGSVLNQLAGAGEIRLEFAVLTVIGESIGNEDASERAGRASFCADVAGVFPTYHDAVFAGQPEREGDGFTDEQLRVTFANQAGLQGSELASFQRCYDLLATKNAFDSAQQKALPSFDHSTPQVSVNGQNPMVERNGEQVPWWTGLEATPQAWQQAIADHS